MQPFILSQAGATISNEELVGLVGRAGISALKERLTLRYHPAVGPTICSKAFRTEGKMITLPLNVAWKLAALAGPQDPAALFRGSLPGAEAAMLLGSAIRRRGIAAFIAPFLLPHQAALVKVLLGTEETAGPLLGRGAAAMAGGAAVLYLGQGQGKTFVAAGVAWALAAAAAGADRPAPRVLYITMAKLCPQVREEMKAVWPEAAGCVAVISIDMAAKAALDFFAEYATVVMDECHAFCSPQRSSIFFKTNCAIKLAMTGEPGQRRNSFDDQLPQLIGATVTAAELPGCCYEGPKFCGAAHIIRYFGPREYTKNLKHCSTGKMFVHYMYQQFAADAARTNIAVDELMKLWNWRGPNGEHHCVFVFSDEKANLEAAKAVFDAAVAAAPQESAMFVSGVPLAAVAEARVLWSTYSYGSVGVSIRRATSIVMLTPRMSGTSQTVGRILRLGGDTTVPRIVIDIVDAATGLTHQAQKREECYAKKGFSILLR